MKIAYFSYPTYGHDNLLKELKKTSKWNEPHGLTSGPLLRSGKVKIWLSIDEGQVTPSFVYHGRDKSDLGKDPEKLKFGEVKRSYLLL